MPKYPKNYKDVEYYVPGRKRRIAGSTKATSDFLALVHLDHPDATISQLREIITNGTMFRLGTTERRNCNGRCQRENRPVAEPRKQ